MGHVITPGPGKVRDAFIKEFYVLLKAFSSVEQWVSKQFI